MIHKTAIVEGEVGRNCKIGPYVYIAKNVIIDDDNYIGSHVIIGTPGNIREADDFEGRVYIGKNNIINDHTLIKIGKEGNTIIGDNNIIMNFVNIGHNTIMGHDNEIGAGTIICGHVKIGNENKIKVHCSIRNRIEIGNKTIIGMGSNVIKSVPDNFTTFGNPIKLNKNGNKRKPNTC